MRPAAELGLVLLKAVVQAAVYRKLVPSVVKIVLLILLSLGLFAASGALLIYQIYLALIHAGFGQGQALAVMCGGLFALAFISAIVALRKLEALQAPLHPLSGIKQNFLCAARAFSEGIQTPPDRGNKSCKRSESEMP